MDLAAIKTKKKLCSMIAIILMLTMIIPLTFLSTTNAHSPPWNIPSNPNLADDNTVDLPMSWRVIQSGPVGPSRYAPSGSRRRNATNE